MASNVLTARVLVEAPGVQNTFNQVAAATNKAGQNLKNFTTSSGSATQSLVNLSRVAQDAPYGFLGIANNLNPLLESFQRLKTETGSVKGAFSALKSELGGAGGLGLALGVVSSLLVVFGDSIFGTSKKMQEAKTEANNYADAIKGIYTEVAKEVTQVATLVTVLRSETETRERKLSAIKKLQSINPEVFNGLKLEGEAVAGLDAAYTSYLKNLTTVITLKIKQQQLESLITKQLQLQGQVLTQSQQAYVNVLKAGNDERKKAAALGDASNRQTLGDKLAAQRQKDINALQDQIDALLKNIGELGAGVKLDTITATADKVKVKAEEAEVVSAKWTVDLPDNFEVLNKEKFNKTLEDIAFGTIQIPKKFLARPGAVERDDGYAKVLEDLEKIKASFKELQAIGEKVGGGLADAFNSIFDAIGSGKNPIKAVGEAIKKLIIDLIQAAIRAFIVQKIIGLFTAGASSAGIGSLVGLLAGKRAAGGPVSAGGTYLVGERGPELFTPNTGGNIVPNHALNQTGASLAGGMTVRIVGEFRQSGQDLIAAITLANQSKARLI